MTIKDFNLLDLDVYDEENKNIVYSGMCENAPEELKQKQIKILGMDGKKLIIKLI